MSDENNPKEPVEDILAGYISDWLQVNGLDAHPDALAVLLVGVLRARGLLVKEIP